METLSLIYVCFVLVLMCCVLPSIVQRKGNYVHVMEAIFLCTMVGFMVYTWPRNGDPILLYLSAEYTQGDIYTRESANDLCQQLACRQSVAVINFLQDTIESIPQNYGVSRYSSVWFDDELIAYSWEEFMKSNNIPSKELYWTGFGKNCNEWSGVGLGTVGKSRLDYGVASCNDMHRVVCLCV